MTSHLLACQCGSQTIVSIGDSGSKLVCPQCNGELMVPEMAKVRRLPEAPTSPVKKKDWAHSFGICLISLGIVSITTAKLLLPWAYWVNLGEAMPAECERWLYWGLGELVVGILITWITRKNAR